MVDIPSSVDRYQSTLKYAKSEVDFVLGVDLYMIPSDMDLYIGTINGYNNLIVIASSDIEDIQLGQNTLNDEPPITQEMFESPPDDFDFDEKPVETQIDEKPVEAQTKKKTVETKLTHDETKLFITILGVVGETLLIYYLK